MFGKAACVFGRDETVPKSLHQGEHDCCIVRNEVLVFPVCIEKKHRKSRPEHRSSAFWEKLKIFLPPLVIARKAVGSSCLRSLGVQASTPTSSSQSGGRCVLLPRGLVFGRIFDRRGWDLSHLSYSLGGSLFGFEQLPHGHRLVDVVFGLSDLFAGDQEPHIDS
jgi:hypothetical protein